MTSQHFKNLLSFLLGYLLFLWFNSLSLPPLHPRENVPALKHAVWEKDVQRNGSDKQAGCTVL